MLQESRSTMIFGIKKALSILPLFLLVFNAEAFDSQLNLVYSGDSEIAVTDSWSFKYDAGDLVSVPYIQVAGGKPVLNPVYYWLFGDEKKRSIFY